MFLPDLINEQPFATKLFTSAIKTDKLAQAYMFTQSQAIIQYNFSLELAKILNCTNKINGIPCNTCMDCKWISQNAHPAVITISPVDFKSDEKKSTRSKNLVNAAQARLLQKTLMSTSKYYRVIIFTGAIEEKIPAEQYDQLWLDYRTKVMPPEALKGRELWCPTHLNKEIFGMEPSNILLKTIEEPFGKILFIFITKDPDDMISTIVSRCQVIPLLSRKSFVIEPSDYIHRLSVLLPPINELDSIKIAKKLIEFAQEEQIDINKLLEYIEIMYKNKIKENESTPHTTQAIIKKISEVEKTKNMIKHYVNPQAALTCMLNSLIE